MIAIATIAALATYAFGQIEEPTHASIVLETPAERVSVLMSPEGVHRGVGAPGHSPSTHREIEEPKEDAGGLVAHALAKLSHSDHSDEDPEIRHVWISVEDDQKRVSARIDPDGSAHVHTQSKVKDKPFTTPTENDYKPFDVRKDAPSKRGEARAQGE